VLARIDYFLTCRQVQLTNHTIEDLLSFQSLLRTTPEISLASEHTLPDPILFSGGTLHTVHTYNVVVVIIVVNYSISSALFI
jgi:hypothetical protein